MPLVFSPQFSVKEADILSFFETVFYEHLNVYVTHIH